MRVIGFDFDPDLLKRFLDFPAQHHASEPDWIPDPAEGRQLADGGSPSILRHNFLVLDGDEVQGRVTAAINPKLCDEQDLPFGQLGFFDCVDDLRAARLLMDAGMDWLRGQLPGGGTVLAPMNFDTWHAYRLRTMGFDQPTFFMEPYNPPYYPSIFATMGFLPSSHYVTKTVTDIPEMISAWRSHYQDALAKGWRFRSFDRGSMRDELSLIYGLSLLMFRENLHFTEISGVEFRAMYSGAVGNIDPDLFTFLLDPSGEPVGLSFSLADHRQRGTVNAKTFGVLPHARGRGLGAALACEIYRRFHARGFTRVNHCLMRAGNRAERFDGGLGEVTREYTLYSRSLQS